MICMIFSNNIQLFYKWCVLIWSSVSWQSYMYLPRKFPPEIWLVSFFIYFFLIVSLFPCLSARLWSHVWRSLCLRILERSCPMAQFSASWPITCDLVLCQSSTSPHRQWWANTYLFSLWPKHNLVSHKTSTMPGSLCVILIYPYLKAADPGSAGFLAGCSWIAF